MEPAAKAAMIPMSHLVVRGELRLSKLMFLVRVAELATALLLMWLVLFIKDHTGKIVQ